MRRRRILKAGLAVGGALAIPTGATADDSTESTMLTGTADPSPPADAVDVSIVDLFGAGVLDNDEIEPAGDYLNHTIVFVGGPNEAAAEFYREQPIDLTVGGQSVADVKQYLTEVQLLDQFEDDIYGFALNYVVTPQSPGTYDFELVVRFTEDGPPRGSEPPWSTNPFEKGDVIRVAGDYTVEPSGDES